MGGEKFTSCKGNRSQSSREINVGDEETEIDALWPHKKQRQEKV